MNPNGPAEAQRKFRPVIELRVPDGLPIRPPKHQLEEQQGGPFGVPRGKLLIGSMNLTPTADLGPPRGGRNAPPPFIHIRQRELVGASTQYEHPP